MSIDLEYAIKQDIRNNPVVREVDRTQRREFLRTLGWAGLAVGMLIFALVPRASALANGYKIETLKEDLARELVNQRKYHLELETLLRPQALEERALRELQMVAPTEQDTLVLRRLAPPAPASRAIVAAVR
jgi:hypothetical protein